MAKKRILVIGNSVTELHIKTKAMPERGEISVTDFGYSFIPGGRAFISAVATSRLGHEVLFCTKLGNDSYGDKLRSVLVANDVNPRFIITDKKRITDLDTVITDSTGIPRIISYRGASVGMCDADLEEALISYPDAVLIQGDLSCDNIYETVYLANKKKIPVILDPAGVDFSAFDLNALGDIEIFTPNADEVFSICGIRPNNVESCLRACVKIIGKIRCRYIVIKLGEKGSFVFDGVYSEIAPSFETEVVDRRGVGSIFNAGLVSMYLSSGDIVKGVVYASVCSSLCLSKEGEYSSIPTIDEINDFIEANKLNFD